MTTSTTDGHPELATSTTSGHPEFGGTHPWLVRYMRTESFDICISISANPTHDNKWCQESSIKNNNEADSKNMCPYYHFPTKALTTNAIIPSVLKVRWADDLRRKLPHLFWQLWHTLSDTTSSQPSPLDVAPTNVPIWGSGESISFVTPQENGSAPPYTSESSLP